MDGHSFMREGLMLSFLAILVFLIYSNILGSAFVFDDRQNIQENPNIRLSKLTLEGITRAGLESPSSNRPVANISFALNYYFHQYNVVGYHFVNILIHITAGIFLYLFAKTTLSIPALHSRYGSHRWIPFLTSCIWLVHPIQTQSVTYIVQRMNSMAAMFYVLSLLLYAKARLAEDKKKKWALFAGCIMAGILALGSKEIAVTLPLFILLYEWYFFQELSRTWLKRHFPPFVGILILLALVALMFLGAHPLERILTSYETRDFTLTQRVLTEFRVVFFYISLLIFPHPSRLNLDHDFPISYSLIDPITTLLSMGTIMGLIGLSLYMAKKERLISFCILWFLGNLVIESSVIGLEIVFEHRTYLPSMLVSLMAVVLVYQRIKPKWLMAAVLCAVVMVCSVWAYERNSVWSDHLTLFSDVVEKSPNKVRPHYNLGNELAKRGRLEEAINHYFEALRIEPDDAEVHDNLGIALGRQGRLEEAISHCSKAVQIRPNHANSHYNLGLALALQGRQEEAMRCFSRAVRIRPDCAEAHLNLGAILASQGKLDQAINHFSEVLRIRPDLVEAKHYLRQALKEAGKLE
jgi:Flp pilus assembly protein TadD